MEGAVHFNRITTILIRIFILKVQQKYLAISKFNFTEQKFFKSISLLKVLIIGLDTAPYRKLALSNIIADCKRVDGNPVLNLKNLVKTPK